DVPVAPEAPTEHCVLFVVDQKPDGEFVMAGPDCFTDEQTAEWWAQTARFGISDSPSVFAETTGMLASATFTLGRHYDGYNGSGSSIRIVGSSCTGGYWNTSSWWDNRISSSYNVVPGSATGIAPTNLESTRTRTGRDQPTIWDT
ncbi:MAG TPA: hypothetical protein VE569_04575, partial [Acidimicrobiia bacterium]|nr:hypothetical protein [Acidimicrobiia bacterium]